MQNKSITNNPAPVQANKDPNNKHKPKKATKVIASILVLVVLAQLLLMPMFYIKDERMKCQSSVIGVSRFFTLISKPVGYSIEEYDNPIKRFERSLSGLELIPLNGLSTTKARNYFLTYREDDSWESSYTVTFPFGIRQVYVSTEDSEMKKLIEQITEKVGDDPIWCN